MLSNFLLLFFFSLGFIFSLFVFFKLTRDDIKLISLRLTDHAIFDIFFATSIATLFGARTLFVISNFSNFSWEPLKIILFTHYPGLSFLGGVAGGAIFLFWYLRKKHILKARIFDIAALSSLPVIILGFLGNYQFYQALFFLIFAVFLINAYSRVPAWFTGGTALLFLIYVLLFTLITFVAALFAKEGGSLVKLLTVQNILSIVLFNVILIVSTILFVRGAKRGYI